VPPAPPATTFAALGVHTSLLDQLQLQGLTSPSPVQAAVVPLLLAGRSMAIQSATGSGKVSQRPGAGSSRLQPLLLLSLAPTHRQLRHHLMCCAACAVLRRVPVVLLCSALSSRCSAVLNSLARAYCAPCMPHMGHMAHMLPCTWYSNLLFTPSAHLHSYHQQPNSPVKSHPNLRRQPA
jgi:hypothetical protein